MRSRTTDRAFTAVRVAAMAVCAPMAAGLVWVAVGAVSRWAADGRPLAVTPVVVVLAAALGAVVVLARSGAAVGAGPSSPKAPSAAKRGEVLAAVLTGLTLAGGLLAAFVVPMGGLVLGIAAAALFALSRMFHRAAAILERSAPPALPAPGAAVHSKPVDVEGAAASPPYPYPSPLPAAVKAAHRDAVVAHGFRATGWGMLIVLPGMPLVVTSLLWGLGRHGSAEDSLWSTSPLVAAGLLGGGLLCLAIAVPPTVRHAKSVSRHQRLLKAYGVVVNAHGVEIPHRQR